MSALPDSPALLQAPVRPTWLERLVLGLVIGTAALAWWVLASVPPDPRGHGTHERLGLTPCSWPATMGIPCPTCGVTTAACHVMHGQLLVALRTQPFGALLAMTLLVAGGAALWHLATNRSLVWRASLWPWGRIVVIAAGTALLSWGYKAILFAHSRPA